MSPKIKQKIKKSLNPLVILFIYAIRIKIHGRSVVYNSYTKKLPGVKRVAMRVDAITAGRIIGLAREKEYQKWFKNNCPNDSELKKQKSSQKKFKHRPLISILLPTYNTNPDYLTACISSVLGQTYDNWELCIADDKSTDPKVREVIEKYAKKDQRIKYVFRNQNGHIAKASNSALELAAGQYIALLDHDDVLWPNALFANVELINQHPAAKFIYSDEDKLDSSGKKHIEPFFKPNWSFEFLRSINYITHFAVLDRQLVNRLGGFRPGYEGAQDWDLFLRASRQLEYVYHIPTVLYSWRKSETSTAQAPSTKDYAYVNQKKALQDDISVRGLSADLSWQIPFSMWRVDYQFNNEPLVSIIIPTKDQFIFIKRCLDSILDKTTYKNFELVIVDTGSTDKKVWELYDKYSKLRKNTKIIKWHKAFNFAAVCNLGAKYADGEQLLFLNNDTEVISSSWIQDMVGYARQDGVGAVGCKLFYPNGKLQHAGIILGVGGQNGTPGIAGHYFPAFIDSPPQDPAQLLYVGGTRNYTAVTAACVMVSKTNFNKVGGFDPVFRIAFNDVDFCLKLFKTGLRNVYLPHVALYHHESISVGQPGSKQRNLEEFKKEINLMLEKWEPYIKNDPFYHPEFRRDIASARLKVT